MPGYDQDLSRRLQKSGNILVEMLKAVKGTESFDDLQFAGDVCRKAFGCALDPEAYAKLDDEQARALLPQVEAAIASPEALTAFLRDQGS